MFEKSKISQSMLDAVNSVLESSDATENAMLNEKVNVKKRTTDTLAGRVKIPATSGDNEHSSYKVELNAEEMEKVDEVLDTYTGIKSYMDKSAVKRDALRNSPENKIAHPDYDKTSDKIRKSFHGSNTAINKWNKKNSLRSTSEEVDGRVAGAIRQKVLAKESMMENAADKVTMDIPLLIRVMEYAKEDASSDMDLHKVAERMTELSASGDTLSMENYDQIISAIKEAVGGFGSSYTRAEKEAEIAYDHEGEDDDAPRYKSNSYRRPVNNRQPEKPSAHAVHINGKKWKTFETEKHANNIMNSMLKKDPNKKITVVKEDASVVEGKRPEDDSVPFITTEVASNAASRIKRQLSNPIKNTE